jgi:hypothetical protein
MKSKSSRIFVSFILVGILVVSLGCGLSAENVLKFLSPETATPTSTSTATSTATPTKTPIAPVGIIPCSVQDLCPDIPSAVTLAGGSVAPNSPVAFSMPYDSPVYFGATWTAVDDAVLDTNLVQIHFIFEVDGQSYSNDAAVNRGQVPDVNDPSILRPAVFTGAVVNGWQLNVPHTIKIGFWFDNPVNNGWVDVASGPYVYTYNVTPADLPTATPLPTATNTPKPRPTAVPGTPTPSCDVNSYIEIDNTTGGQLTLYLKGPASFTFYLGTGVTNINVCAGTYSYTAYGCGGASNTGTISTGESHEFYCS